MKLSSDRLISRGKTIFGSRAIARIVRRVSRWLITTRHSAEKGGELPLLLLLLLRLVGTSTYVMPITVPTILTSKHRFVTVRLCTRYSVSAYLALTITATTTARRHPFAVAPPPLSQIARVNVSAVPHAVCRRSFVPDVRNKIIIFVHARHICRRCRDFICGRSDRTDPDRADLDLAAS